MRELLHKRGDTLAWGCAYTDDAGQPINLTGYSIASQIRHPNGTEIATLEVTIDDPRTQGTFLLGASEATTAGWLPGLYRCDVQFTSPGGEVYSTDTFNVRVVADVTQTGS